ncbi:dihydrofolate reductase family protein, partial [Nocardia wallacei]|uniref:dihydrofolate reductase family protein n=1 Tax=Nocardia wallacei TaxID=480035 RepID=UPI002453A162
RPPAGKTGVPPGFVAGVGGGGVAGGEGLVGLWGGGAATAALRAGLVDEVVLHQVPILLGGGRPFFHTLPEHIRLRLVEAVPAPGVTHLRYEVRR